LSNWHSRCTSWDANGHLLVLQETAKYCCVKITLHGLSSVFQLSLLGPLRPQPTKIWKRKFVKLMVVGDSGLGKTTLISALLSKPGEQLQVRKRWQQVVVSCRHHQQRRHGGRRALQLEIINSQVSSGGGRAVQQTTHWMSIQKYQQEVLRCNYSRHRGLMSEGHCLQHLTILTLRIPTKAHQRWGQQSLATSATGWAL